MSTPLNNIIEAAAKKKKAKAKDLSSKVRGTLIKKGGGDYSDVYLGTLSDGTRISVKKLRLVSAKDERDVTGVSLLDPVYISRY